jgi:putative ABC transport system permease protein
VTTARLLRVLRLRWRSLTRSATLDAELDRELAFHYDQLVREHADAGLGPVEARRAARQALGNVAAAKDDARDHRRLAWVHDLRRDIHYAARTLRARPGFTTIAIGSLALGIGANAAVLSAINTTLWRPLSLAHVDRLVILRTQSQVDGLEHDQASLVEFRAWQREARSLESVEASFGGERDVSADAFRRPAIRIATRAVTPGWFDLLGIRPYRGRLFTRDEYVRGRGPEVMLISYQFWQSHYGLSPDIINQVVRVNGIDTRIVGIMPPDFAYQSRLVHAWFPLRLDPYQTAGSTRWFNVIARRRPGISLADAQADAERVSRAVAGQLPKSLDWRPHVVAMSEAERGWARRPLWALEIAACLVLLVACANVAGLLIARNATRQQEFALRAALGASHGRLVRQLLAETGLLSAVAATIALAAAWPALRGLTAIVSPPIGSPRFVLGGVDLPMLGIIGGLTLIITVTVGMIPAFLCVRSAVMHAPAPGSPRQYATPRGRLRGLLVAVQIAASVVLLVSATLVVQSFVRLAHRDLRFDGRNLLIFQLRVPGSTPRATLDRVYGALGGLSDVDAIGGVSDWWLTTLIMPTASIRAEGATRASAIQPKLVIVTPGFFTVLRTRMVNGREFDSRDTGAAPWSVVLNQETARRLWPTETPIGKHLTLLNTAGERPREVVGVVPDMPLHREDLHPTPMVYTSSSQQPPYQPPAIGFGPAARMAFLLRYTANPNAVAREAQRRVASIAPDLPLIDSGEAADLGVPMLEFRNYAVALSGLAIVAMMLAIVGLYGVTSHAVVERTREIGIRMALGAARRDVMRTIGRTALAVAATGLGVGVAGALALPRWIAAKLWGLPPTHAGTILGVLGVVAVTVFVTCWLPLRRALRIQIAETLRAE